MFLWTLFLVLDLLLVLLLLVLLWSKQTEGQARPAEIKAGAAKGARRGRSQGG
jgi:hypothetical protein